MHANESFLTRKNEKKTEPSMAIGQNRWLSLLVSIQCELFGFIHKLCVCYFVVYAAFGCAGMRIYLFIRMEHTNQTRNHLVNALLRENGHLV